MNWQPIETAPRDGTVVMFYVPTARTEREKRPIGRGDDFWYGRPKASSEGFAFWLDDATHWIPLAALTPEPPK